MRSARQQLKRGSGTRSNAISLQLDDFHIATAGDPALDVFGPARQRRAPLLGERAHIFESLRQFLTGACNRAFWITQPRRKVGCACTDVGKFVLRRLAA